MNHRIIQNRPPRPFAAVLIALVAFAVLTSPILTAYAAAPVNAISYQGRLLDSSGNPVSDANVNMQFSFHTLVAGGACLWSNDDSACGSTADMVVPLTDGLFSVNLGDTGAGFAAIPDSVFADNSAVFLQVIVGGETLVPRKQLVAAPFALNSQSLDGLDSTAFLSSTGDTATGAFDLTGATIAGTSALSFEGGVVDGFQTTLSITNPTADNIIALPDASGTLALTSDIPAGSSLWETGAFGTFEDDGNVLVGTAGDETLLNAAFTLSGNDLFVADTLGVEGSVYSDGAFVAGTTSYGQTEIATAGVDDLTLSPAGGFVHLNGDQLRGTGALGVYATGGGVLALNTDGGDIIIGDDPGDKFIRIGGNGMRQIQMGTLTADGYTSIMSGTTGTTLTSTGTITIDATNWSVDAAGAADFPSIGVATPGSGAFTSLSASSLSLSGDLDMANNRILNIGNAGTDFTAAGGLAIADDLSVGGTAAASSPFGVDESANTVYVGEGANGNGTLTFKASDADTGSVAYSTDDRWEFTGGDLFVGGSSIVPGSVEAAFSPNGDDLYVAGDIAAVSKMYADSFTAGDASTTYAQDSITTGAGGDLSLAITGGDLTFAQNTVIGDGGDQLSINTSDWDVSTAGAMTGIATVASDDNQGVLNLNIPVSGADVALHAVGLQVDGNGGVVVSATGNGAGGVGARTVDIGVSGATDTVNVGDATSSIVVGGATANVSLTDADWSVSAGGVGTFSSLVISGDLDMANHAITNIGNAGTDFVAGTGALTLAGVLTANGNIASAAATTLSIVSGTTGTITLDSGTTGTVNIGTGTSGKAINIGSDNTSPDTLTIGSPNDTMSLNGTMGMNGPVLVNGNFEVTGGGSTVTFQVPMTANGTVTLGDNGDTVTINSSDWDISSVGNMSGIGTISADGDITTSADLFVNGGDIATTAVTFNLLNQNATTINFGAAATTMNIGAGGALARAFNVGTGTGNDTITLDNEGTGSDTVNISTGGGTNAVSVGTGAGVDTINIGTGAGADVIGIGATTGTLTLKGGAASTIDYTNFKVAAGGNITIAAGGGLDTIAAGTINLGNINATAASICNSAACDLVQIGINADADTITLGDAANDTTTLNGSTVAIDSADWDISTTGNMSGIGSIGADGDFTTSGDVYVNGGDLITTAVSFNLLNTNATTINFGGAATTMNIGAGGALARAFNVGTGTGNDTITLDNEGTGSDTVNISTGGGTNAVSVGTGAGVDTINIGTGAGADVIGIGANTGTMTIRGGSSSLLSFGGTGLDSNSLDFVGAGDMTTGIGTILTLDASSATAGTIQGGVGDDLTLRAADISADGTTKSSPLLTIRGTYDSNPGNAIGQLDNQNYPTTLQTIPGFGGLGEFDVNVNGGATELTLDQSGTLTAIGGVAFGDGTGVDKFSFNTAATVDNAMTLTANSVTTASALVVNANGITTGNGMEILQNGNATQTAGSALLIQRSHSGATNFTSSAGLLNVSQLDTDSASTGPVAKFINAGSGSSLFIDANGDTGGTVSDAVGGALHITNTGNTGYGLSVYSNQSGSSSQGALSKFYAANASWDGYVMEIESGATDAGSDNGSALHIVQNDLDAAVGDLLGTQALAIDTNKNCGAADGTQNDGAIIKIREDAAGTPDTIFRFECDGDLFLDGTVGVADAVDVAENFPSTDTLTPGELVSVDPSSVGVLRTSSAYDSHAIGVVSTLPGLLLGSELPGYKIALAGRVPMNVSDEGGAIAAGDPIASSSTPGVGMKSTQAGTIVGFALEAYSGTGVGSITAFVSPQFYVGSVLATDGSATTVSGDLALTPTGTATATTTGFDSGSFELRGSGWDGTAGQGVQMSMATDVTSASDYRLSIKNTAGSEVAYVSQAGDMAISGRLYPSDRGTLQTSKYIYYDGSSGSGGDFMRTNASGWATGSYDFAEMFPSVDALEAGDVVMFGTSNESVLKSTGSSASLAGIVSTRPGFLAGENRTGDYPIALAGRVPTKVSLENGPIAIGDPLTASATKGYAMKAVASGPIVGYALEAYSGSAGTDDRIVAFVNAGYWSGGPVSPTPGTSNAASTIIVNQNANNLTALNMEGNVYLAGNDILGVRRIAGLSDRWSLDEDGTVRTQSTFKSVIESYQGEKIETTAVTSPDVQITLVGTATLENGEAVIRFEDLSPTFNDVTSTSAPIRVVVTPNGPVSLYVYEKNNDGFGVRQMNGSDSGVTFDWMVSAFRKDFEPAAAVAPTESVPATAEEVPAATTGETAPAADIQTAADPIPDAAVSPTGDAVPADTSVSSDTTSAPEAAPQTDSTESNSDVAPATP